MEDLPTLKYLMFFFFFFEFWFLREIANSKALGLATNLVVGSLVGWPSNSVLKVTLLDVVWLNTLLCWTAGLPSTQEGPEERESGYGIRKPARNIVFVAELISLIPYLLEYLGSIPKYSCMLTG